MKTSRLLALALCAVLALTGCSLARPEGAPAGSGDGSGEETASEARFIGLYLVYGERGDRNAFGSNPNLTELGDKTLEAEGFGSFTVPREVLLAEWDEDKSWVFPGMEGFYLLCTETVEDGAPVSAISHTMDQVQSAVSVTDEGVTTTLSGTIYMGPPLDAPEDWSIYDMTGIWDAYKVYQTAEGVPYLDGSGDSFSGGPVGYTAEESWSRTVDGETEGVSISVKVQLEEVPRLGAVTLYQYGAEGQLLSTQDIPLDGERRQAAWEEGALWAVVEETDIWGNSTRASYDRPGPEEEPIYHAFVLLDDRGVGSTISLMLAEAGSGVQAAP